MIGGKVNCTKVSLGSSFVRRTCCLFLPLRHTQTYWKQGMDRKTFTTPRLRTMNDAEILENLATLLEVNSDAAEALAKRHAAHGEVADAKVQMKRCESGRSYAGHLRRIAGNLKSKSKRSGFVPPTIGEVIDAIDAVKAPRDQRPRGLAQMARVEKAQLRRAPVRASAHQESLRRRNHPSTKMTDLSL